MPNREPHPRQKANGAWFVRWAGKDHYLSTDELTAQRLWIDPASTHAGSRTAWLRWRARRAHAIEAASPRHHGQLLLIDVAEQLFESYAAEGRKDTRAYYQAHLARFLHGYGGQPLLTMSCPAPDRGVYLPPVVPILASFRAELALSTSRYSPRTINHDITAVKRLFAFAASRGFCPAVNFGSVRSMPVPRSQPEDLPPRALFRIMRRVHRTQPLLAPYIALQYLTLARPSEVVELICTVHPPATTRLPPGVHRRTPPARRMTDRPPLLPNQAHGFHPIRDEHGAVVAPRGLFALTRHKNSWRSGRGVGGNPIEPRWLVLNASALAWLDSAVPLWSSRDSYTEACARAWRGFGPRMLRDSGASHLRSRGVALADVQILLGHSIAGEWPSYARTPWPDLLRAAGRLAL